MFRRQIVGLGIGITGLVDRIFRREREQPVAGVGPTGRPAGPISRTLAFLIDAAIVTVLFSLGVSLGQHLVSLFTGGEVKPTKGAGPVWVIAFFLWWGFYLWIGFEVAGCTPGKALLGMRVRDKDGGPLKGGRALVRVIVYPFSFILALGLIPGLLRKDRRALHDLAAGSQGGVIDWERRDADCRPH
ncbi:MAG: RDD family protein [Acidimicrobiales bacterium]